jgi:predicted 3-demethylubiquinone-9 3-methyltransferase (glyoxalase superfamily)
MQKITPFLWFDNNAGAAVDYYTSIFNDSKVISSSPGPDGKVQTATFELNGQQFIALNGGPEFPFTEAVSFFVSVETQAEVDYYWDKLTADGGEESQCGWLKDKFGLSWQIVPTVLGQLLGSSDREKAGRALQAMLKMRKLDIAALNAAYEGH